jgi:hypothetical protein
LYEGEDVVDGVGDEVAVLFLADGGGFGRFFVARSRLIVVVMGRFLGFWLSLRTLDFKYGRVVGYCVSNGVGRGGRFNFGDVLFVWLADVGVWWVFMVGEGVVEEIVGVMSVEGEVGVGIVHVWIR